MYTDLKLFIDGKWHNGEGRKGEDVINPATGKVLGHLPHASKADLDEALAAAQKAFPGLEERPRPMTAARSCARPPICCASAPNTVATSQTMEQGKAFGESRIEVLTSADIIDWYAEEGRRSYGRIVPGRMKGVRQIVVQEPVGVVAAFTPWNFPTLTPVRKIAGALGGRLLAHHQGFGRNPGRLRRTGEMFRRCRPAGGRTQSRVRRAGRCVGASDPVRHRAQDFLHRLDSGRQASRRISPAKGMKRATMELGGHSPVVVFDDADPEKAADTIAAFKYRNAGQVCISPTRFYVQEKGYNKFVARFTEYAKGLKLGDGLEKTTTLGPLANPRRLDAMESLRQ